MKRNLLLISAAAVAGMLGTAIFAQSPAASKPPAGSTASCRDGTFSTESNRDTACAANRGVKEWWGKAGPTARSAIPATSANAPMAKTADGKALVQIPENQVLADPATKMYQLCTTSDEHEAPPLSDTPAAGKSARPAGTLMSEEEAKAQGFRPGAHKVNCGN